MQPICIWDTRRVDGSTLHAELPRLLRRPRVQPKHALTRGFTGWLNAWAAHTFALITHPGGAVHPTACCNSRRLIEVARPVAMSCALQNEAASAGFRRVP
jgi:hypothetical protein